MSMHVHPGVPPQLHERALLLLMAVGNLVVAVTTATRIPHDEPLLWPLLFVASSLLLVLWVCDPSSRQLYAASGAVTAGAYLTRSLVTAFTILDESAATNVATLTAIAWGLCFVLVSIAWGRLRPTKD